MGFIIFAYISRIFIMYLSNVLPFSFCSKQKFIFVYGNFKFVDEIALNI